MQWDYMYKVSQEYNGEPSGISNRFLGEMTQHQSWVPETDKWGPCREVKSMFKTMQRDLPGWGAKEIKGAIMTDEYNWNCLGQIPWPVPFAWPLRLLSSPLLTIFSLARFSRPTFFCFSVAFLIPALGPLRLLFLISNMLCPYLYQYGLFMWMAMPFYQRALSRPIYPIKPILPWQFCHITRFYFLYIAFISTWKSIFIYFYVYLLSILPHRKILRIWNLTLLFTTLFPAHRITHNRFTLNTEWMNEPESKWKVCDNHICNLEKYPSCSEGRGILRKSIIEENNLEKKWWRSELRYHW